MSMTYPILVQSKAHPDYRYRIELDHGGDDKDTFSIYFDKGKKGSIVLVVACYLATIQDAYNMIEKEESRIGLVPKDTIPFKGKSDAVRI